MLRRSLILTPALLVAPAIVRAARRPLQRVGGGGGGGFTPDGSFIQGKTDGTGASPASLNTPYGLVAMVDEVSPQPGYGGGAFYYATLNGVEMNPSAPLDVSGLSIFQQIWIDFGSQIIGITNDQLWYSWSNYSWQSNDGADLSSGPAPTPFLVALPTYAPPYTNSSENTTISGGGGTLTTQAGVFSFGAGSSGTGWRMMLNGIPIAADNGDPTHYTMVDMMTVYGVGQLFFRLYSDSSWHCWTGNQRNASTGPTASPVPVGMALSPPRPTFAASSPVGTTVGTVSATMSDSSGFAGTVIIGDTTNFSIAGNLIKTAVSPFASSITALKVAQNGTTYEKEIIIVAV